MWLAMLVNCFVLITFGNAGINLGFLVFVLLSINAESLISSFSKKPSSCKKFNSSLLLIFFTLLGWLFFNNSKLDSILSVKIYNLMFPFLKKHAC